MIIDIKQAAVGKWASILTLMGIDETAFSGRHGPCPICGGKDRFRFNRQTEVCHCNQCGSLGGMDLAMAYTGRPFKELAIEIKTNFLGVAKVTTAPTPDTEKTKAFLKRIHGTLSPITGFDCTGTYLNARGITSTPAQNCWQTEHLAYFQDGVKQGDHPAMVAAFRNLQGALSTYHVTYLDNKGNKANVASPKKIMPTLIPLTGCSIQLFKADKVLAIAEGIETALAVHDLEGVPVWASGNAQLMAAMEIPESVEELLIYADSDPSFTGQKAAYTLANKYALKGLKVRVNTLLDKNWLLDSGDKYDFLDYLNASRLSKQKAA